MCRLIIVLAVLTLATSVVAQKASIAIVPFDNKADIDDRVSDVLVDMLTTSLVKSSKFDVLERSALDDVTTEQMFGASGAVDELTAAEIGKVKGADFMVIGIVTEAGFNSKNVNAYGLSVDKSNVYLALDVRFVESTTGQVRFADTLREVRSTTNISSRSSRFDIQSSEGSEIARAIVDELSQRIATAVYPPKILAFNAETGDVTINYGEMLFSAGQKWQVYGVGQELTDPDTGEKLGSEETLQGEVEIVSSTAKLTKAKLVEGTAAVGSICRKRQISSSSGGAGAAPRKKVDPF